MSPSKKTNNADWQPNVVTLLDILETAATEAGYEYIEGDAECMVVRDVRNGDQFSVTIEDFEDIED